MCEYVHEWVYAAQVLDCFAVLLIPSIFCQDSKDVKLRTTKSWRAIETERKTLPRKIMSNYVKLKWLNLQNDRVEWIFIFLLSSSVVAWMFEKTEQRPTSWNNPTQAHNLSIYAFSHAARLPIKNTDHYRHGDRRLGDVIKQAFRTACYQKVAHWWKEFSSLLKLT